MADRTKGRLDVNGLDIGHGADWVAHASESEDDAAHLAACWNAFEDAGVEPADGIVLSDAEVLSTIRMLELARDLGRGPGTPWARSVADWARQLEVRLARRGDQ